MIANEHNGLIINGDHRTDSAQNRAVEYILDLSRDPKKFECMSKKAQEIPWSTETIGRTWVQHWQFLLNKRKLITINDECDNCTGRVMRMVDGDHCIDCGSFEPRQFITDD
jgi:hypothetical protein